MGKGLKPQCLSVNMADGLLVGTGYGVFTYENSKYGVPSPYNYGMFKAKEACKHIRKLLGDSDAFFVPKYGMEVFRHFPKIGDGVA